MNKDDLIQLFENSQIQYNSTKDRKFLKETSQFFTPLATANKMLKTIDLDNVRNLNTIKVLEPSAGCGILILGLVLHIVDSIDINHIEVTAYELDKDLYQILHTNLIALKNYIERNTNINLTISIHNENFILAHSSEWCNKDYIGLYDIIISNPPFNKINQSSKEAIIMKDIVYGQPNIYTLFIGMCLKLLAGNGVYSVISPRNYLSGDYSKKLREYIFKNFTLTHIHSFDNRNIFKLVNQEIIISTYVNNQNQDQVQISYNGKFKLKTCLDDMIHNQDTFSMIIPSSSHSTSILDKFKVFENSLADLGFKISVGPVVQFRNTEFVYRAKYSGKNAPLLISNDIQKDNTIDYYTRKNNPKRKTHNKSISIDSRNILPNDNYLLLRKVTAKDDKDILVTTVLEKNFLEHHYLGLDNNLLYFHKLNRNESLSLDECYGLYCYINSTYFEEYYLLISGTHTINVSDFNNVKLPDLDIIKSMGNALIGIDKFDKETCSNLMDQFIFNETFKATL